jgi:hypothetical protein
METGAAEEEGKKKKVQFGAVEIRKMNRDQGDGATSRLLKHVEEKEDVQIEISRRRNIRTFCVMCVRLRICVRGIVMQSTLLPLEVSLSLPSGVPSEGGAPLGLGWTVMAQEVHNFESFEGDRSQQRLGKKTYHLSTDSFHFVAPLLAQYLITSGMRFWVLFLPQYASDCCSARAFRLKNLAASALH